MALEAVIASEKMVTLRLQTLPDQFGQFLLWIQYIRQKFDHDF